MTQESGAPARIRLDKWLWAARFYRTRSLAAQAIEAGAVRVDGERVKPAHIVRPTMRVTVRRRDDVCDVDVLAVSERRGSATEAAALFRETPESATARERARAERLQSRASAAQSRPTKRDRRRLEDFLNEP
jgi:ribosome-associated heat shock protein Hsp15